MKASVRHTALPLLAAMIWGTAFSAQSVCATHIGPFTLNALRGAVAFLLLLLLCLFRRNRNLGSWRDLALGGLCCGTALFLGSNLQQLGLGGSSAGKAGFLTAMYIVIVPAAGIFFGKKAPVRVWLAVAVAVVGMYFLCITEDFSVSFSDLCILLCAFLFAAQILAVDHFAGRVDGIALSCAQFLVLTLFSAIGMCAVETPSAAEIVVCLWPLLYIAVFSSCVAYTFQILAQKDANPAVISLLLSLESVFAVLGGAVLLGERLTAREGLGCALMMGAIVLAQLPTRKAQRKSV
ncbi:MAG: DMT family transporter [Oscillospiraceae bacterium]|nr:DMT family transporter [Oscillospiraceae bacterium]